MLKDFVKVDLLTVEITFAVTALGIEMSRPCREFVRGDL